MILYVSRNGVKHYYNGVEYVKNMKTIETDTVFDEKKIKKFLYKKPQSIEANKKEIVRSFGLKHYLRLLSIKQPLVKRVGYIIVPSLTYEKSNALNISETECKKIVKVFKGLKVES